jgi:hypothetical protein
MKELRTSVLGLLALDPPEFRLRLDAAADLVVVEDFEF